MAQFPEGAPLRSNAEAIANNRCLAALPRKSTRRPEMNALLCITPKPARELVADRQLEELNVGEVVVDGFLVAHPATPA